MSFNQLMRIQKKEVKQYLGDVVINQHQGIHVKLCLTDIWVMKKQNDMETRQCKYCTLDIFLKNRT